MAAQALWTHKSFKQALFPGGRVAGAELPVDGDDLLGYRGQIRAGDAGRVAQWAVRGMSGHFGDAQ
jgi:hypothetical protein